MGRLSLELIGIYTDIKVFFPYPNANFRSFSMEKVLFSVK